MGKRKYKGYSLVEMLLTIMILAVVTLLVAITLNTVIKVSNTTNSKNLARSDINHITDLVSRMISNSQLKNIHLYKSDGVRSLNADVFGNFEIVDSTNPEEIANVYNSELTSGVGNEIHVKLYGYDIWACIGYFLDENLTDEDGNPYGYIVKTTSKDLDDNHASCFEAGTIVVPLHAFMIDANEFTMEYVDVGDGKNNMFIINVTLEPLYWPVSDTFPVTRSVSRQAIVSTQALTWY